LSCSLGFLLARPAHRPRWMGYGRTLANVSTERSARGSAGSTSTQQARPARSRQRNRSRSGGVGSLSARSLGLCERAVMLRHLEIVILHLGREAKRREATKLICQATVMLCLFQ